MGICRNYGRVSVVSKFVLSYCCWVTRSWWRSVWCGYQNCWSGILYCRRVFSCSCFLHEVIYDRCCILVFHNEINPLWLWLFNKPTCWLCVSWSITTYSYFWLFMDNCIYFWHSLIVLQNDIFHYMHSNLASSKINTYASSIFHNWIVV